VGHLAIGHLGAGARQHHGASAKRSSRGAGGGRIAITEQPGQADGEPGAAGHQRHFDGGLGDIQQVLLGEGIDHGVAHVIMRQLLEGVGNGCGALRYGGEGHQSGAP
jgi:hypothetical protein